MRPLLDGAEAFARFWYGFLIGDDWTIAAGVLVGLGATYGLLQTSAVPAWWLLPVLVIGLLATSIRRANRREQD